MGVMLTQVLIEGVDVTPYLVNYEIEKVFGDAIAQVDMNFVRTINDAVALNNGDEIIIWRGWASPTEDRIFWGYIERFEPEAGKLKIVAKDKAWDLVRREITQVYDKNISPEAGVISEIFKSIVQDYGGLTANVEASPVTYLIDKFVCNHVDPFERCKKLADILDWQFYYSPIVGEDWVRFEPKGYVLNPNSMVIGDNVMNVPKWTYDITEMINDLTVVGAYQEVETTEKGQIGVTAGYTTTSIDLSYIPIATKVWWDTNPNPETNDAYLKVGGVPDSTAVYDYYVDKTPEGTSYPRIYPFSTFPNNNYVTIWYSLAAPIPIHLFNQPSIDTYGMFKKTITYTDIRTVEDASSRGEGLLARYSTPFIYGTLKVKNLSTNDIKVGQLVNVSDDISLPIVHQLMVINRHRIRYPSDYDELDVGDKYFRLAEWNSKIEEKIKRLEENEFANQDIVFEIVDIDNTVNYPIRVEPRYNKTATQTATAPNVFILGNANHGRLGTDKLGDAGMGAEVTGFIQQFRDIYNENFMDNDFKDAGNTTANWDTVGRSLLFAVAQQGQSTSIDYNNGVITQARITATEVGGAFPYNYYLTADGGANWESVTNDVNHTFTNTGQDLRWRIITTAGEVSNIKIDNYH